MEGSGTGGKERIDDLCLIDPKSTDDKARHVREMETYKASGDYAGFTAAACAAE